jgi:hypothetical protein
VMSMLSAWNCFHPSGSRGEGWCRSCSILTTRGILWQSEQKSAANADNGERTKAKTMSVVDDDFLVVQRMGVDSNSVDFSFPRCSLASIATRSKTSPVIRARILYVVDSNVCVRLSLQFPPTTSSLVFCVCGNNWENCLLWLDEKM